MTIDYLVCIVKKSKAEVIKIIEKLGLTGNILVGNQLMESESIAEIEFNNSHITIYNLTTTGVSKNRNFLLNKSTADYITFIDDDGVVFDGAQKKAEDFILNHEYNCVRFNVVSKNNNRQIKQLNKKGFVGFKSLSSFGVWGIFFKRQFLLDKRITFREDIGPGTDINHGEDGIFLKEITKITKIYSCTEVLFSFDQFESTWQGANRNLENELVSHGYVYSILYPKCTFLAAKLYLVTHMWYYPKHTSILKLYKWMKIGILKEKKRPIDVLKS